MSTVILCLYITTERKRTDAMGIVELFLVLLKVYAIFGLQAINLVTFLILVHLLEGLEQNMNK